MIKQNDLIFLEVELFIFYNMLSSLLSHPGIPRVTLCFCTGSYTATDALSHTGGDFMFLYRFVCRRWPQILDHAITFEQLFGFLLFLAGLLALTYRLPD